MEIDYRIIESDDDKLRLFQFRKQVFVNEEKRWETEQDYIIDEYDNLDETINLAAVHNGQIIAALRVTPENQAGFPVDQYWDSKPYRSRLSGLCANIGWLCCAREYRHSKGLVKNLVELGMTQAKNMHTSHIISVIHPPIYDLLHNCFGVIQIGKTFKDSLLNLDMMPIYCSVDEFPFSDKYSQYYFTHERDLISQGTNNSCNLEITKVTPDHSICEGVNLTY